jgi:hypothetical protein
MKKKNRSPKLTLHRETLIHLSGATGGDIIPILTTITTILSRFPCSNEISVCKYCTTPLDTCPGNDTIA